MKILIPEINGSMILQSIWETHITFHCKRSYILNLHVYSTQIENKFYNILSSKNYG